MKDACLVDFHHSWLIEITPSEPGFQATCCSPCRRQLVIQKSTGSDFDMLCAAKQAIDYQLACGSLSIMLRQFYEAGQLSFHEWHSLQSSLSQAVIE